MSLLGAAAFAMLTRLDAAVYIVALQRFTTQGKVIHIKRLNTIVRWMQSTPVVITYRKIPPDCMVKIIADSAFKNEDGDKGHALKGALFLRGVTSEKVWETNAVVHVLDYYCRTQRHVTRSTFGAELFSACDAIDHGMLLATILHQIATGVCDVSVARNLREQGGWTCKMALAIDAMSVYAAVTAQTVKTPAEKSLLSHVQYLRELLDRGVLHCLTWIDTRDMLADGLTKGNLDRGPLHKLMKGTAEVLKEFKSWISPLIFRK